MSECTVTDDACDAEADEFCFSSNAKGPHCTKSCAADLECPSPSPGCNRMGVCKAPD